MHSAKSQSVRSVPTRMTRYFRAGTPSGVKTENYIATELELELADVCLEAELIVPDRARGLVLFAHGSGSTRHTYRNCDVAAHLRSLGYATFLFNLLSRSEEALECIEPRLRFDVPLLADRLIGVTKWLRQHPGTRELRCGLFGASTGATAAILAAAELPELIDAVVSRGGRPDLTGEALRRTLAPTLLVVGAWDDATLHGNREAIAVMRCEKHLAVIPNATHRFEEPGAIARVADLAADWFGRHLDPRPITSIARESSASAPVAVA